jgi:hypothetical protein
MKKYFEVEVEHTGVKTFHIELNGEMSQKEALWYISNNYANLGKDYNAKGESETVSVIAIIYREER